jgi:hypothetical protein
LSLLRNADAEDLLRQPLVCRFTGRIEQRRHRLDKEARRRITGNQGWSAVAARKQRLQRSVRSLPRCSSGQWHETQRAVRIDVARSCSGEIRSRLGASGERHGDSQAG